MCRTGPITDGQGEQSMTLEEFRNRLLNCHTLAECTAFIRGSFAEISRLFYDATHVGQHDYITDMKSTFDAFMTGAPMTPVCRGEPSIPDPVRGLLLLFASYFERAGTYAQIVHVSQLPAMPVAIQNALKAIHKLRDIRDPAQHLMRFDVILPLLSSHVDRPTATAVLAEYYATGRLQNLNHNPDNAVKFAGRFVCPEEQARYSLLGQEPLVRLFAMPDTGLAAELSLLNLRVVEALYDTACQLIGPPPVSASPAPAQQDALCLHTLRNHGGHCSTALHRAKECIAKRYAAEFAVTGTFIRQPLNSRVYTSFETRVECVRYFRQYMPLHMPQIEAAVCASLQKASFDRPDIHILDIGGGPGNLYCVLAALLRRNMIPMRHYHISVVEPAKTFHDMLDVISHHVAHDRLTLRAKYDCRLDQLAPRISARDVDWFFIANVITPLVAQAGDVPRAITDLHRVINAVRRPQSTGFITIAENSQSADFGAFCNTIGLPPLAYTQTGVQCDGSWLQGCQFYVPYAPNQSPRPRLKYASFLIPER